MKYKHSADVGEIVCVVLYIWFKRQNFKILEKTLFELTVSPARAGRVILLAFTRYQQIGTLDHLAEKPVKSSFDCISFSDF